MGLLDEFFTAPAGGGGTIDQIARQVGGSPEQVRAAMRQLTPAVTRGIQRQAGSQDGLGALLEMLQTRRPSAESRQSRSLWPSQRDQCR